MNGLRLVEQHGSCLLPIKVSPGASRSAISGIWNDRLKVSVQAPPERGKANEEIVELLSDLLQIKRGRVMIVKGHTSAKKTVKVNGLSVEQVMAVLQVELDNI